MELSTFESFRKIVYRECGIVLTQEKLPLLSNRIHKRLLALGLDTEDEYLKIIEVDLDGSELVHLIDAVSTNVTFFYREEAHFTKLREILAEWKQKVQIRIWCAAASSGEEPYTLAFEALETLGPDFNFKILATDVCTKVLQKAVAGCYSDTAVQKIPDIIKKKYLTPASRRSPGWEINESVQKKILFKHLNLIHFPYPLKGSLNVIFCRNVMIYFDSPTRERIVTEFTRLLAPGGYLFLSHSENLLNINHSLEKLSASIYRKAQ